MAEIEESSYAEARSLANQIGVNADNMMSVFNDIDNTMNTLYGESWLSSGAETAEGRYRQMRKKYEEFYDKVMETKAHINDVTARNEETDKAASNVVTETSV